MCNASGAEWIQPVACSYKEALLTSSFLPPAGGAQRKKQLIMKSLPIIHSANYTCWKDKGVITTASIYIMTTAHWPPGAKVMRI